ncbi:MAG: LacI family DNA-binding transcriptional regulator [Bacteroidetes bacterium]|nr:LacI family DNA-binding transcriptional regulator [Bacteroidota bacterium]
MKRNTDKAGVKEIARRAKVSLATVDRVIHNRSGVSEKTKAKIQAIIEELNYQPNVLAQRLALTTRGTIRLAVLLPTVSEETEYWQAPLEGVSRAETEIMQYGIHIERYYFDQNDSKTFVREVEQVMKYKPDGILFTPLFPEEAIRLIRWSEEEKIPYAVINSDIPGYDYTGYIGPDIFHSGYLSAQLVDYCIDDKHAVLIVNISGEIDNNYAILHKEDGFRAYFKDNNLPNRLISFKTTQTDYASVTRKLLTLMKAEKDIGAIFVTNSRVSLVARCLESHGLNDIILLGNDLTQENVACLKKGSIDFLICEKPQEQGYRGIMTLFQHLVFSKDIEKTYLMPIDIITRQNYQFYRN